jgi:hypothetical protein
MAQGLLIQAFATPPAHGGVAELGGVELDRNFITITLKTGESPAVQICGKAFPCFLFRSKNKEI